MELVEGGEVVDGEGSRVLPSRTQRIEDRLGDPQPFVPLVPCFLLSPPPCYGVVPVTIAPSRSTTARRSA